MHQALSGAKIYYAIRNKGSSLAAKQWWENGEEK